MKKIEGFNYFITENGTIFNKHGKKLKLWLDSKKRYYMVSLCKNGKNYKRLVHRLVAGAFLENNLDLPEVNHKDYNTKNNKLDNLEWCTRKENARHSLLKNSPIRNFIECKLYVNKKFVGEFQSVLSASNFAKEYYNGKFHSLMKNHCCTGGILIKI